MGTQVPQVTMSAESITVVWQGKPYTVAKGSPNYQPLRKAILEEKWSEVPGFLTISKSLSSWTKGKFRSDESGENVFFDGRPVHKGLATRITTMMARGESVEPLLNFWERLQRNPSWRSVEQLWPFLDHEGIPLTKDGCFLAYKGVSTDFKDKHTGTIDNRPGVVNEMPRNQISDDPREACHYGFHVGALRYASSFASRVVVCKVDPADVVCVPYDNAQQKIRVCRYRVVGNHGEKLPDTIIDEPIVNVPVDVPEVKGKTTVEDAKVTRLDEKGEKQKVTIKAEHTHKKVPPDIEAKQKKAQYRKYHNMDLRKLLDCSLDELRQYATYGLDMVGASKVPGGKPALVEKIIEHRSKNQK